MSSLADSIAALEDARIKLEAYSRAIQLDELIAKNLDAGRSPEEISEFFDVTPEKLEEVTRAYQLTLSMFHAMLEGSVQDRMNAMYRLEAFLGGKRNKEGMQQGRSGQLAELVAENLRAGRRPEEFADFLGLTVDQVEEIARGKVGTA